MCDHGRLNTFKSVNSEDRVDGPHIRKEGSLEKAEWKEALNKSAEELKKYSKNEIAFIGSPYAALEDNYLLARFASALGSKNIDFKRYTDPYFEDNILRRDDITPNSLGAEVAGIKPGEGGLNLDGIINGIKEGKIKALYLIEDDIVASYPELGEVFSKLDLFIVNASNFNKTTVFADIVFPAAAYAEKNGTIVNFQGRVQRLKPAVSTIETDRSLDGMALSRLDKFGTKFDRWALGHKYDAKSSWKIISALSGLMGFKLKFNVAEEVFNQISGTISVFNGLDYDVIGELGAQSKLKPVNTIAAG
jgi:predicted molibdopterin-dependent oxidoreductase YjgC